MLANEYAVSIYFENKNILRFAHKKGVWYFYTENIVKTHAPNIIESNFLAIEDTMELLNKEKVNSTICGLLEAYIEQAPDGWGSDRSKQAWILEHVLTWWAGLRQSPIKSISVEQQGRNAVVDIDGKFHFAPRPNEYLNK